MKIAVIEDDLPIANMYKAKLELADYEVRLAHDGIEGFELMKEFVPDITLLDIKMPQMNGDEMLEKVRATDWGSGLRVVVLTNISKDEAPSSLRFLGIERYIVKAHHTPSQVLEIVEDILKKTKQKNTFQSKL